METDYGKIFCEATSVIIQKELEGLQFDVTRTCVVIDDAYKKIGRYTVQENNLKYEAYSLNTNFTIGDNVLVLIPKGDYNLQKTILNKIVDDANLSSSASYISPLKQMLKFTNNIIERDNIAPDSNAEVIDGKYFSLLANEETKNNIEQSTSKLLYSINWENYNNYNKLGISVDFQNQLKNLGALSGDYGLEFLFFGNDASFVDQENKTNAVYSVSFGVNDILGNPYNFPVYFTQEKVIDIANLSDIKTLNIYFYQKGNFKNELDEYIISEDPGIYGLRLTDNIFVGNIQLFLGYSVNEFSDSQLFLSTTDNYNYSRFFENNEKNLNLSFIHKIDENNYEVITNPIESKQEMEIYWVRYNDKNTDQTIKEIVGERWTTSSTEFIMNIENGFNMKFNINKANELAIQPDVRVKAVCRIRDENGYWTKYESNILNFLSVDPVVDETTYNRIKGLTIQCLDNSYGYYFLYNQNNEILDESKSIGYERKLQIQYNGERITSSNCDATFSSDNIKSLTWYLPHDGNDNLSYSMLIFTQNGINSSFPEVAGTHSISFTEIVDIENFSEILYNIKKEWYVVAANNTITCQIELKNGEKYSATTELVFGKADSQGGNYRLNIGYNESNKNAFEIITTNGNFVSQTQLEPLKLKAILQDKTGKVITTLGQNWEWNWKFYPNNKSYYPETNAPQYFSLEKDSENNSLAQLSFVINQQASNFPKKLSPIVKLELKIKDDNDNIKETIISYFPIAIKTLNENKEARAATLGGARKIIYNSLGTPSYYTGSYELFNNNAQNINVAWEYLKINNDNNIGYPTFELNSENEYALKASLTYVKKDYESCVVASVGNVIYWIQPILIIQSDYDLISSSDWNGEVTVTDDTKIISSQVAAGKMDEDGKFSGILMGSILDKVDGVQQELTGLIGISKGISTLSITDSGALRIGKNGVAINFGEDDYSLTNDDGFTIDVDAGVIADAKIENSNFSVTSNNNLTFEIKNGIITTTQAINIKNDNYINGTDYLLSIGKLKINSNGEVYYGSQTLENYIKSLAQAIVDASQKT